MGMVNGSVSLCSGRPAGVWGARRDGNTHTHTHTEYSILFYPYPYLYPKEGGVVGI